MPEQIRSKSLFKVKVEGEHRTGFCEDCQTPTEKEFYMDGERKRVRVACPKCGGLGKLIARSVSIQQPVLKCFRIKCLYRFFIDTIFCGLLSNYHQRRVTYAEANRNKVMPEKYRTGRPAPQSIWQAVIEILKLKFRR